MAARPRRSRIASATSGRSACRPMAGRWSSSRRAPVSSTSGRSRLATGNRGPSLSGDCRNAAFVVSGRPLAGVYVAGVDIQAYPGGADRRPISTHGGASPVWREDSRELYFTVPHPSDPALVRVMAVIDRRGREAGETDDAVRGSLCEGRPGPELRRPGGWAALPHDSGTRAPAHPYQAHRGRAQLDRRVEAIGPRTLTMGCCVSCVARATQATQAT